MRFVIACLTALEAAVAVPIKDVLGDYNHLESEEIIFEKLDANNDGEVDFTEFVEEYYPEFAEEPEEAPEWVHERFECFDFNKDGVIDWEEHWYFWGGDYHKDKLRGKAIDAMVPDVSFESELSVEDLADSVVDGDDSVQDADEPAQNFDYMSDNSSEFGFGELQIDVAEDIVPAVEYETEILGDFDMPEMEVEQDFADIDTNLVAGGGMFDTVYYNATEKEAFDYPDYECTAQENGLYQCGNDGWTGYDC